MGRQHLITEPHYNGQSIRADKDHPVIEEIVEGFQQRLNHMNQKHAQTFVVNCIAKFPKDTVAVRDRGGA